MTADDERALKVKVVKKLASNGVTGAKKKQIDTVMNWGFASHNKGKIRDIIEELATDPDTPVELYGGRDVVRLTSMADAKDYIKDHGGDLPWGLRD